MGSWVEVTTADERRIYLELLTNSNDAYSESRPSGLDRLLGKRCGCAFIYSETEPTAFRILMLLTPSRDGKEGWKIVNLIPIGDYEPTGLRRKELRCLTPRSINIDSEVPTIVVSPADVKTRQPTVQVIRRELADELKRWIENAEIAEDSPLWPQLTQNTAMMLRKDLKAADIEYVDDSGLFADFHAPRHSYISLVTKGGVHPRIAQRLARHSDINLTMSRYSHTLLNDEVEALQVLPQFPSLFDGNVSEPHPLRATGTNVVDSTPENVLPFCLPAQPAFAFNSVQLSAVNGDDAGTARDARNCYKTLEKEAGSQYSSPSGEVAEWPNAPVLKCNAGCKLKRRQHRVL